MKFRIHLLSVFLMLMLASLGVQAQSTPSLASVVDGMARAQAENHDVAKPYTVTREYKFFQNESAQPDSEVVAEVSFVPPDEKEFSIQQAKGSGRGASVVKRVLEHESAMASDWHQSAVTEDNYKFTFLGEEVTNGRRCYVLGLEPKRDSKELIKGKAWVDAQTYRIHRIEGEPVKSPSWWIKNLQITLLFSGVDGMWLQTATQAKAEVRMFGTHTLSSHDLSYKTGDTLAKAHRSRSRTLESSVGTAIFVH